MALSSNERIAQDALDQQRDHGTPLTYFQKRKIAMSGNQSIIDRARQQNPTVNWDRINTSTQGSQIGYTSQAEAMASSSPMGAMIINYMSRDQRQELENRGTFSNQQRVQNEATARFQRDSDAAQSARDQQLQQRKAEERNQIISEGVAGSRQTAQRLAQYDTGGRWSGVTTNPAEVPGTSIVQHLPSPGTSGRTPTTTPTAQVSRQPTTTTTASNYELPGVSTARQWLTGSSQKVESKQSPLNYEQNAKERLAQLKENQGEEVAQRVALQQKAKTEHPLLYSTVNAGQSLAVAAPLSLAGGGALFGAELIGITGFAEAIPQTARAVVRQSQGDVSKPQDYTAYMQAAEEQTKKEGLMRQLGSGFTLFLQSSAAKQAGTEELKNIAKERGYTPQQTTKFVNAVQAERQAAGVGEFAGNFFLGVSSEAVGQESMGRVFAKGAVLPEKQAFGKTFWASAKAIAPAGFLEGYGSVAVNENARGEPENFWSRGFGGTVGAVSAGLFGGVIVGGQASTKPAVAQVAQVGGYLIDPLEYPTDVGEHTIRKGYQVITGIEYPEPVISKVNGRVVFSVSPSEPVSVTPFGHKVRTQANSFVDTFANIFSSGETTQTEAPKPRTRKTTGANVFTDIFNLVPTETRTETSITAVSPRVHVPSSVNNVIPVLVQSNNNTPVPVNTNTNTPVETPTDVVNNNIANAFTNTNANTDTDTNVNTDITTYVNVNTNTPMPRALPPIPFIPTLPFSSGGGGSGYSKRTHYVNEVEVMNGLLWGQKAEQPSKKPTFIDEPMPSRKKKTKAAKVEGLKSSVRSLMGLPGMGI